MSQKTERREYHLAKNRLETLVDGVFAIAMTLLVLTIALPKPPAADAPAVLPGMILGLIPQILLYGIAFLILGIFWLRHHRQFYFVHTIDPHLLWINIFLLISIVFVPFSTDIAGDYPTIQAAVLLFHINILAVGLMYTVQWRHICNSGHLCDPFPDAETMRLRVYETLLIPAVASVAILISFFNATLSMLVYIVIPPLVYFQLKRYVPADG